MKSLTLNAVAVVGLMLGISAASAQAGIDAPDGLSARNAAESDTATTRNQNRSWIDYLWGDRRKRRVSRKHERPAKAQTAKEGEAASQPRSALRDGTADGGGRTRSAPAGGASLDRRHARTRDATGSVSRLSALRAAFDQSIIKGQVRRAGSVDVPLKVGATVPLTIHLRPLPAAVVRLKPAWRGHEYFVSGKEIVIVEPTTSKIVDLVQYTE
jgi:hypothetical protein